jgi:hypothetical protein
MNVLKKRNDLVLKIIAATVLCIFIIPTASSAQTTSDTITSSVGKSDILNVPHRPGTDSRLGNYTFKNGTYVMPMDDKQADMTGAFGFAHAMLRNGSYLYRIIEPPNSTLTTDAYPSGSEYRGGPILFMPNAATNIAKVSAEFTSVVLHRLTNLFISHQVFVVREPTTILWMNGDFGHTGDLLTEMKIPFTTVDYKGFNANQQMIWDYSLFIDDCSGLTPSLKNETPELLRNFVAVGNEVIFTCYALRDFKSCWPGYVTGNIVSRWQTRDSNITELPEFPAQYDGPANVTFDQIWTQAEPVLKNVSDIARGKIYDDAMYYNYGHGIVEFFSFHPGQQLGAAKRAAIILYGNKFLHYTPGGDKAITSSNEVSPNKIATKGTSLPAFEEATINLTAKPVGFNVVPADNCTVNYRLCPYIDNVTDSFVDDKGAPLPPNSVVVNPDNSKDLIWKIDRVKMNKIWKVSFKITSTQAGTDVLINDWKGSNVTYTDEWAVSRERLFMDLKINVVDKFGIPEMPFAAGLIALVSISACLFKRRKET